MQLSPHHAGLAGLQIQHLLLPPALPPCSCPLAFQRQVKRLTSRIPPNPIRVPRSVLLVVTAQVGQPVVELTQQCGVRKKDGQYLREIKPG